MRGVVLVVFDDPASDIDTEVLEASEKMRQATGGTKRIVALSGQPADDLLDLIELHGMPEANR